MLGTQEHAATMRPRSPASMLRLVQRFGDAKNVKRELRFFVLKDGPSEAPVRNQHCTWGEGSDQELAHEPTNFARSSRKAW